MVVALGVWEGRIAPVFDVAKELLLLYREKDLIRGRETIRLSEGLTPQQRVLVISEMNVDELICGAISSPLRAIIEARGTKVCSFITGSVTEIEQALGNPDFDWSTLAMPGCYQYGVARDYVPGQGGGFMRGQKGKQEGNEVSSRGANGGSLGRRGRCAGRGGKGGLALGGYCVCSQCGYRTPHQRGIPCSEIQCPECGIPLIREF